MLLNNYFKEFILYLGKLGKYIFYEKYIIYI